MMTRDEAVTARIHALKLERLYHAYRAASRASAMVMTRISDTLAENEQDPDQRFRLQQRLVREIAVSRENDLVFQNRAGQLRRRIDELDKYKGTSS